MRILIREIHKLFRLKCPPTSLRRTLMRESNEGKLTGRFLLYMNGSPRTDPEPKEEQEALKLLKGNDFRRFSGCDAGQLASAVRSLAERHRFTNAEFSKITGTLDAECCRRLDRADSRTVLEFLKVFAEVNPSRIVEYEYYRLAVNKLIDQIDDLSKTELVQLVFFAGLSKKKSRQMLAQILKRFDESLIQELTIEDICIVCSSTFKASMKIRNTVLLDKITKYLNDNLHLLKDPGLFITLIKTIRHNRYQTEDLLATISCTVFFNRTLPYYSFTALCHILALYSDFLYYDPDLLQLFTSRCIELLKNCDSSLKTARIGEQPRLKDIKRLLWALSNLNYKNLDKDDIKNVIVPQILKLVETGEADHVSLVEIMLYLWMMNYRAYELVPYALTRQNMEHIEGLKSHAKLRLNLLLTCIYFEDPELSRTLQVQPKPTIEYHEKYQLQKRPGLLQVLENLKGVADRQDIDRFELGFQIPGLNILGITGYRKKIYRSVHIEVLDEYTTLKNTEESVTGPMDLKLRILDKFDEGLIVIGSEELEESSDKDLQEILLDEIQLVC